MSNDRLKFRAWDDENMCWVRPKMVQNESGVTVDERGYELFQWTGLYDSEGSMVFEGDLLRYPPKNSWERANFAVHEVFYHDGDMAGGGGVGYRMCRIHYHGSLSGGYIPEFLPRNTEKMVVAGNIHEHPDLMERANG